jgi:hypothetical protein
MRHEALPAQYMMILVFWLVTACELVGRYQNANNEGSYVPLKCWYLPICPYNVLTQKTNTKNYNPMNVHVHIHGYSSKQKSVIQYV